MLKKLRDSWLVTSPVIPVVVFLTILYLISLYNWAMFHSLIEITLAILAFSIFAVTWSSRRFVDNSYLVFIGISFLFMGILTILHEVVSAGGKMFSANSTDELTIQTWTAVRYIQSLSFLVAPLFLRRKIRINLVFLSYIIIVSLFMAFTFEWRIVPQYLIGEGKLRCDVNNGHQILSCYR